jgi:hypothetical protein
VENNPDFNLDEKGANGKVNNGYVQESFPFQNVSRRNQQVS